MGMTQDGKPAQARSPLETELGFRIEVSADRETGSVVWIGKTAVRPATGVEVKLWETVQRLYWQSGGIPADTAKDPFGTPKDGGGSSGN